MKAQASLQSVSRRLAAVWGAIFLIIALLGAPVALRAQTAASHGIEYRGGRWFDGTRFVPRTR